MYIHLMYYWLLIEEAGKVFKDGWFKSEDEARNIAIRRGVADYRIFPLPTRDAGKAGQMMRGILYREGKPVKEIFSRHFKIKQQDY